MKINENLIFETQKTGNPRKFMDVVKRYGGLKKFFKESNGSFGFQNSEEFCRLVLDCDLLSLWRKLSNFSSLYIYCPFCKKFHPMHEYVHPIGGWDALLDKYSYEMLGLQVSFVANQKYRSNSGNYNFLDTKDEILEHVYDDEYKPSNDEEAYVIERKNKQLSYFVPLSEFENDENGMVLTCPSCKERIPFAKMPHPYLHRDWFSFDGDRKFGNSGEQWKFRHLTRSGDHWKTENKLLFNYEIFVGDDDKITLSLIYHKYYPNIQGKLHVEVTNVRYVMNTKTGMTYKFRELELPSHKPVIKDERRITNSTYGSIMCYENLPYRVIQDVVDAICKKKGVESFDVKDFTYMYGGNFSGSPEIFCVANAYTKYGHDFCKYFFRQLCLIRAKDIKTREKTELKKMQDNPELFEKFIKKNGIKGKKRINMIVKNPMLYYEEKDIRDSGFTDNNVILSILEDSDLECIVSYMRNNMNRKQMVCFIADYAEVRSEAELVKKMKKLEDYHAFGDLASMYYRVIGKVDFSKEAKNHLFTGSLKDIHDNLSRINDIVTRSRRDYYIPYTEDDLHYNLDTGGYSFSLAKNSYEMSEVGRDMNICVGSYDHKAYSHNCFIVFMRDKTGKMAACIELSGDGKELVQAKDYCNGNLKKEKLDAIKTFCVKNKISYKNCYDCCVFKQEGINILDDAHVINFQRNESKDGYMLFENPESFEYVYMEDRDSVLLQLEKDGIVMRQRERYFDYNEWDFGGPF